VATQHFNLLTIRVADNGSGPYEAEGLLAEEMHNLPAKHPFTMAVGGALARLKRGRATEMLGLDITTDLARSAVAARPTGLLAPLIRKRIANLTSRMSSADRPITEREGGLVYNLYLPPVPSERMIRAMSRNMVEAFEGRKVVRPTTATVQATSRCQLDCYHCSAARYKSADREELTTEEWVSFIQQAQDDLGIYNIMFTGGEPLLRPDILDLVRAVDRRKAHAGMFSNGLLLTDEKVAQLREAGLYAIMISIDDPRPEVHNNLRRTPNGFEKASEGIKRALAGGLLVGITTYAGPQDVRAGIPERVIELGRELGVHELTILDVVPTGKLLGLAKDELLTPEDKGKLIEMDRHYNSLEGYPHIITQAYTNSPLAAGCFAGFSQMYMTSYGDVNPCDFAPLTFGNIRDEPLKAIWDRMLTHPAYEHRCKHCRMQDPDFRARYIDPIPDDAPLPWPAFEELRGRPNGPTAGGEGLRERRAASCAQRPS
jgi:MoaA/NifB/PqqE/SkfB family radical SAM enzyme